MEPVGAPGSAAVARPLRLVAQLQRALPACDRSPPLPAGDRPHPPRRLLLIATLPPAPAPLAPHIAPVPICILAAVTALSPRPHRRVQGAGCRPRLQLPRPLRQPPPATVPPLSPLAATATGPPPPRPPRASYCRCRRPIPRRGTYLRILPHPCSAGCRPAVVRPGCARRLAPAVATAAGRSPPDGRPPPLLPTTAAATLPPSRPPSTLSPPAPAAAGRSQLGCCRCRSRLCAQRLAPGPTCRRLSLAAGRPPAAAADCRRCHRSTPIAPSIAVVAAPSCRRPWLATGLLLPPFPSPCPAPGARPHLPLLPPRLVCRQARVRCRRRRRPPSPPLPRFNPERHCPCPPSHPCGGCSRGALFHTRTGVWGQAIVRAGGGRCDRCDCCRHGGLPAPPPVPRSPRAFVRQLPTPGTPP